MNSFLRLFTRTKPWARNEGAHLQILYESKILQRTSTHSLFRRHSQSHILAHCRLTQNGITQKGIRKNHICGRQSSVERSALLRWNNIQHSNSNSKRENKTCTHFSKSLASRGSLMQNIKTHTLTNTYGGAQKNAHQKPVIYDFFQLHCLLALLFSLCQVLSLSLCSMVPTPFHLPCFPVPPLA